MAQLSRLADAPCRKSQVAATTITENVVPEASQAHGPRPMAATVATPTRSNDTTKNPWEKVCTGEPSLRRANQALPNPNAWAANTILRIKHA